jgi:hypothetical protein
MFPAPYLAQVVNSIDVDLCNFFAAVFANFRVAPVEIRTAAVGDTPVVTDVGDVDRLANDNHIARAFVNAAAAIVGIGPEISDVHESVVIGSDVARVIDPCANAHIDFA